MTLRTPKFFRQLALAPYLAVLVVLLFPACAPLAADDRDRLRQSTTKPYVFFILDTSGSMNWTPRCTQAQYDNIYDHDNNPTTPDARECNYVCPTGDCLAPRNGDDPASKFRQAKEALYEVIRTVDDIDMGFATYNADTSGVPNKHWLYRVQGTQPAGFFTLAGGVTFPASGSDEVFGFNWWDDRGGTCTYAPNTYNDSTTDTHIGCFPRRQDGSGPDGDDCLNGTTTPNTSVCAPADTNDAWEMMRFRRLPRLDLTGNQATYLYLRVPTGSTRYRVKYTGAVTLGSPTIAVTVEVAQCTDNKCTTVSGLTTKTINYDRVSDFILYDNTLSRTPVVTSHEDGNFGGSATPQATASNTCSGWDPNSDTTADQRTNGATTINYKQLTGGGGNPGPYYDPTGTTDDWRFQFGDVIPLSWTGSNKNLILNRLAPRLNGGDPASDPDAFGAATYLQDVKVGTEPYLRLKDVNQRPLIPNGSTPLGNSLKSFREWFKGCTASTGTCGTSTGWDDFAAANDPNWGCRRKFIVFLTDGDETCSSDPCAYADVLDDSDGSGDGVSTYVIAFGIQTGTNTMNCMAANGGTTAPILPQNKQQLVDALVGILSQIREEAATFASAAVPQVQANSSDKISLSSFTPLSDAGFWAGRLDTFLKPLPLDEDSKPDRTVLCDADTRSKCFLWDAGDVQQGYSNGSGTYNPEGLLLQAPNALADSVDTVPPYDPDELQLGDGANERRVIYGQFNEPGNRKFFTYPTTASQKYDLWTGMGLNYIVGNTASETAADNRANRIITTVLLEKEGSVETPDPSGGPAIVTPMTYLLGDIFHADPLVISKPSNFAYYSTDPYNNKPLCGAAPDPDRFPPTSYKWFADRNVCRRSVLLAGANDGQLHAFDAGIFRPVGSLPTECLLPAKDLDGDGTSEEDEYNDGVMDFDLADDVERSSRSCTTDAQCESPAPCLESGFCAAKTCTIDSDCQSNLCLGNGSCSGGNGVLDGMYDNGTGREIFSYIPRAMLKPIVTLVEGQDRNKGPWGVDAGPRVDDVFIDPLASENGTTACLNREWRSVLIGGYREGGPGYYALDLTQPDVMDGDHVPQPDNTYVPSCFNGGGTCDKPYPSVLWEYQDEQSVQVSAGVFINMQLDEDLNDERDLGNTWSKVTTGRIRVCTGACAASETEDRFVAIFGGGMGSDPTFPRGNYVYMVDVETGKTIYKKRVIGSIPADIAAIDTNADGLLDRLYFGTTAGYIYKVQFETSGALPMRLSSQVFQTRNGGTNYNFTSERIIGPTGDTRKYDPFQIFATGGRPIYHEIAATFVARENRVALGVGTGNRWNLWQFDATTGRFYQLLDKDNGKPSGAFEDTDRDGVLNITCSGCTQPLTESKYQAVDPEAPLAAADAQLLLFDGNGAGSLPGWYLTLTADEKVITEAFSLFGLTIFTSFQPTEVPNDDGTCSRAGTSHIFIVGTVTSLGYYIPTNGTLDDRERYLEVGDFTTSPFVEQSATKNPETPGDYSSDDLDESLELIRDELKSLQSTRCRYANYTLNIKTVRADTGLVFIAPVAVCIDPTSWKEF